MKQQRSIQRSLIVGCGQVAQQVQTQLQQTDHPAVAYLDWPAAEEEIVTVLQTISQATLQTTLYQQGWQLIRPEEIALFVLWDVNDDHCADSAAEIAEMVGRIAHHRFVVHTAALLITLTSQPDDPLAQQRLQNLIPQPFGRGVFHLSRINELGLQLADEAALATVCATLLEAILFTPLRELPEWAAENSSTNTQEHALGIATWSWSPQTVRQRLAYRWAIEALSQWLEIDSYADTLTMPTPEQLSDMLATPLPPISLERWQAPHPFNLHDQLVPDALPPLLDEPQLNAVENRLVNTFNKVITAALDEQGTPRALLTQLENAQEILDRYQEQNEARHLTCTERREAAEVACTATQQQLTNLLQQWPQPHLFTWLKASLSLWRWPHLLLTYWRIQETGRIWEKLYGEQIRWTQQLVIEEATKQLYHRFQLLFQKAINEVEELLDMLNHVRNQLYDEAAELEELQGDFPPLPIFHHLYERLVPDPALQATMALQQVNGLSQHMKTLDTNPLLTLRETGYTQLAAIAQLTATAMVRLTHPTAEQFQQWWETLFSAAAPLWRNPAIYLSETPARPLFVVCGAEVTTLETQLKQPTGSEIGRWLNSTNPQTIYLVRLRAGIAIAQRS